jgi:hypothetical protein
MQTANIQLPLTYKFLSSCNEKFRYTNNETARSANRALGIHKDNKQAQHE